MPLIKDSKTTIGGLLLLIGSYNIIKVFSRQNDLLGYDAERIMFYEPFMTLLLVGLFLLALTPKRTAGIVLSAIGGVFILGRLGVHFNWLWDIFSELRYYLVPLILLGIGLLVLFRARRQKEASAYDSTYTAGEPTDTESPGKSETLKNGIFSETNIFAGGTRSFSGEAFLRGNITAIFSGQKIDLRHCKPLADRLSLDVSAVFGGVDIVIPKDWRLEIQVEKILGGVEDKRMVFIDSLEINDENAEKTSEKEAITLTLTGTALFGGINIASF